MKREEEIQNLIDKERGIDNYGSIDYQVGVCDGVRLADKTMIESLWHDASQEPKGDNWSILCVDNFDLYWMAKRAGIIGLFNNWDEYVVIEGVKMWAYISDLLPKQFGNSKQEKGGEK